MSKQTVKTPLALAVSAALSVGGLTIGGVVQADSNPFAASELSTGGYMNDSHGGEKEGAAKGEEGKCGGDKGAEGKCGGKGEEGKCGEGKCGGAK